MITKSQPSYVDHWYYKGAHGTFTIAEHGPPCVKAKESFEYLQKNITIPGNTISYTNSRYRKFNWCRHVGDHFSYLSDAQFARGDFSAGEYNIYGGSDVTPKRPSAATESLIDEFMRKRAWQSLYPQLNDGFSLMLFLLELREFPGLLRQANHAINFIERNKLTKYIYKGKRKFRNQSELRKVFESSTAAKLNLIYSFAVAPLISDATTIAELSKALEQPVLDFIEKGRQGETYHYREQVMDETDLLSKYIYSQLYEEREGWYYATLRCKYNYVLPSFLEGQRRMWGLVLTPEVIWNITPFSFIVDWIYDVSYMIRQASQDPNMVDVTILDYCDTWKGMRRRGIKRYLSNDNTEQCSKGVKVWEWERFVYERTPTTPDTGFALPAIDGLNRRQLLLGVSLIVANSN
jgi:hypothetical protein